MEFHKTTAFARFSVQCSKYTYLRVLWCFQFVRPKTQYRALQFATVCYRVLQGATVCYRVLQCATGCYSVPGMLHCLMSKRQWQLTARSTARAYRLAVLRSAHTMRCLFVLCELHYKQQLFPQRTHTVLCVMHKLYVCIQL
jgi:hypothetical protein